MAELSPKQEAFREFFFNLLDEFEINSPAQLDDEGKTKFFKKVKSGWKKYKKENFTESHVKDIKSLIKLREETQLIIKEYLK